MLDRFTIIFYLCCAAISMTAQKEKGIYRFHKMVNELDCYAFSYQNMDEPKPLLLLIHGSPGSHKDWAKYLKDKDLREKYRILAFDRIGFGDSGEDKAYPDIQLQAKVVHRFIKKYANGQKVYLLGHSVGGAIVARCAMDYPDDIHHLVLVAPAISADDEQPRWYNRFAQKQIFRPFIPKDMLISQDEMMVLPPQLEAIEKLFVQIQSPTSLFHGKIDMIAPYPNALYVQRLLGEKLVFFKSYQTANHFIPFGRYKDVKHRLLEL